MELLSGRGRNSLFSSHLVGLGASPGSGGGQVEQDEQGHDPKGWVLVVPCGEATQLSYVLLKY